MGDISHAMAADHRRCDRLIAEAEVAVSTSDWSAGAASLELFLRAMEQHLAMEEEALFPAFEQASGQAEGPIRVMRMEHTQIRRLMNDMSGALVGQDQAAFLGLSETLMMLMQQHNMKEEQMLYPMAENAFGEAAAGVLERMLALKGGE